MKGVLSKLYKIVKLSILCCLKYLLLLCGGVVHKKNNRIIFGSWFGQKYEDNPKYLFEYAVKNRKDLEVMWITSSGLVYDELCNLGLPVMLSKSIKTIFYCIRAKYVVFCTSPNDSGFSFIFSILNKAVFINLWHGVPLKKIMHDDKYNYPTSKQSRDLTEKLLNVLKKIDEKIFADTYHIATSEPIAYIYESAFRTDKSKILILGQARNDYLFTNHVNILRCHYDKKKIIVYMPTHRNEGNIQMDIHKLFNLESINRICIENNAVLLIKKHFYHSKDPIVKNGEYSNICEITDSVKSQTLIDAADILITDYSSVYIDYLLLNRPIIFYAYDINWYLEKDREMYLEFNQNNMPGRICITEDDITDEILNILNNKDSYIHNRNMMRDYYYSKENQKIVSPKQIEVILSL